MMTGARRWLAWVLVMAAGACGRDRTFRPEDVQQITGLLERQRLAWNRGDLPGYMEGYARSPALVFTSGAKIRRGWQATMDAYQRRYGGDRRGMGLLHFAKVEVQNVGPDGAVALGRWRLTDTPQAGSGVFSVVLERRPEGWRIVHDHTSADPPSRAGP
jgi:beta-aspartyl-peptidase (threonine type)